MPQIKSNPKPGKFEILLTVRLWEDVEGRALEHRVLLQKAREQCEQVWSDLLLVGRVRAVILDVRVASAYCKSEQLYLDVTDVSLPTGLSTKSKLALVKKITLISTEVNQIHDTYALTHE